MRKKRNVINLEDAQNQARNRLKNFRQNVEHSTQEEFSAPLGFKQPAYQAAERGVNAITFKLMVALMNEYSISIDWLISGEGPMYLDERANRSKSDRELELEQRIRLLETERDKFKEMWKNSEGHIESYKNLLMEALRKG